MVEDIVSDDRLKRRKVTALKEGVSAAVQSVVTMDGDSVSFGVVAQDVSVWRWCVEAGGILSWIWISSMGCVDTNSNLRSDTDLDEVLRDSPVDVILFDGSGPTSSHSVWRSPDVTVVAWCVGSHRCRPPRDSNWVLKVHTLDHQSVGGVTRRCDRLYVATRTELHHRDSCFVLPPPVSVGPGMLSRVVDRTNQGRTCLPPKEGCDPMAHPISGNQRDQFFVLPCVFSSTKHVRRKLTDREWLKCYDCPAQVLRDLSPEQVADLSTTVGMPFKSRFHVIRSLSGFVRGRRTRIQSAAVSPRVIAAALKRASANDEEDSDVVFRDSKRMKLPTALPDEESSSCPLYLRKEVGTQNWFYQWLEDVSHRKTATSLGLVNLPPTLWSELQAISEKQIHLATKEPLASSVDDISYHLDHDDRDQKAVKSDDAGIPVELWNIKVLKPFGLVSDPTTSQALNVLRRFLCKIWKRRVAKSFWIWWIKYQVTQSMAGADVDVNVLAPGLLAIHHAVDASWWEWDRGSAPFFWRFPKDWQQEARQGLAPRFLGDPPTWRRPQRVNRNSSTWEQERKKISKVRARGYICACVGIISLLSFFSVPKGDSDIRMVYDGTKSGLNDVLYAPWFLLPTVDTMLRTVDVGYWGADNDYGEMFLNFWLHPTLRPYCGVDLTGTFPEDIRPGHSTLWESWSRNAMGLSPSPYASCQQGTRAKRLMLGCRHDPRNVFRWDRVVLNLPGCPEYDPSKPWVYKARQNGQIAADLHKYVDDVRETAPTQEEVDAASSLVAKVAAFLGLQDAARKRRKSAQRPGAWAGAKVDTDADAVYKTVSTQRWSKAKEHIDRLQTWAKDPETAIPRKELESIRGFLVYVSLTYSLMAPYLKGIHLTLDGWRKDRDDEGWKLTSVPDSVLHSKFGVESPDTEEAPQTVKAVPRFASDVQALKEFTDFPDPVRLRARPTKNAAVIYIFGDASGEGFGTTLWIQHQSEIHMEEGLWTLAYSAKSSNFREMCNLALRVESALQNQEICEGSEIFVFTDNQVAERAFYRGTSSAPGLFELVLRMRKLEMSFSIFLHIIWVSGTRMISQGTDGVSRGDLENGVAHGTPMLSFVPVHLTPFSLHANLENWIRSTLPKPSTWTLLDPDGWFDVGHRPGNFIWNVPSAAAQAAVDQLCEAKLARPEVSHCFVVPTVMTPHWRKKLGKIADIVATVPAGNDVWPRECHEPLTIALICPLLSSRPWQIKHCDYSQQLAKDMLYGVWRASATQQRDCMRELWDDAWDRASL